MGRASDAWERRPVLAAVIGPPHAGIPWLRRHLRRHPMLAVPPDASGFWTHCYGVDPAARPGHWSQAFFGLHGRIRAECDDGLAALPGWKVGALAAANPKIRVAFVLRDPAARSWDALRAFHARFDDELRLGGGLAWVEEALRSPDVFRGKDLGLMRDGDYAATLRRWGSHLEDDQIHLFRYDDLVDLPAEFLGVVLGEAFRVGPGGVSPDGGPPPGFVDSPLPERPPPSIAEALSAMHRRQVRDLERMLDRELSSHWGR